MRTAASAWPCGSETYRSGCHRFTSSLYRFRSSDKETPADTPRTARARSSSFISALAGDADLLVLRPGPSRDAPARRALLQGEREDRAGLSRRFPHLLEGVVRRSHDVGVVGRDVDVFRGAECDDAVRDPLLLGV